MEAACTIPDMAAARAAWLATIHDRQEKIEADASEFLRCEDGEGNRIDFHTIRHTSTKLYSSITDPKVTQEIARHRDFETTYGYCVHAGSEAKQEVVKTLAELLSGQDIKRATRTLDTAPTAETTAVTPLSIAISCNRVRRFAS